MSDKHTTRIMTEDEQKECEIITLQIHDMSRDAIARRKLKRDHYPK